MTLLYICSSLFLGSSNFSVFLPLQAGLSTTTTSPQLLHHPFLVSLKPAYTSVNSSLIKLSSIPL